VFIISDPVLTRRLVVMGEARLGQGGKLAQPPVRLWRPLLLLAARQPETQSDHSNEDQEQLGADMELT
jgi:hypothetical protein